MDADRPLLFAQILYIWQITDVQRKETLALLVDNIAAQRPSPTRPRASTTSRVVASCKAYGTLVVISRERAL